MIRAKIYLNSGGVLTIHAEEVRREDSDNRLTAIIANGVVDYPLYICLDDVSAITTERRTLFGWRRF